MKVLLSMLAVSISIVALIFAGCGSPSPTITPPVLVEKPTPAAIPEAPTVAFCDLVSSPRLYNQKIVRTQATAVVMTFEVGFLYDAKCNRKGARMDYEYDNDQASEVLAPLLPVGKGKTGRANVTVVGRFEGPSKEGYGHLNSLPFRFVIMVVEKGEAVPPYVPWPWEVKK